MKEARGRRRSAGPFLRQGGWGKLLLPGARPAPLPVVLSGRPDADPRRLALNERGCNGGAEGDKSQRGDELRCLQPSVHGQGIGRAALVRAESLGVISVWSRGARSWGWSPEVGRRAQSMARAR